MPTTIPIMSKTYQKESEKIRLSAHIVELSDKRLVIEYKVVNEGSLPAFVLNCPISKFISPGRAEIDFNGCVIEASSNCILVCQKMASVPDNMLVENRVIPAASLLRPGASAIRKLTIPLPLHEDSPYVQRLKNANERIQELPFCFELGYFIGDTDSEKLGVWLSTDQGEVLLFDPLPEESQSILRIGPFDQKVPSAANPGARKG